VGGGGGCGASAAVTQGNRVQGTVKGILYMQKFHFLHSAVFITVTHNRKFNK
jgi:hypothetical protein